MGRLWSTREGNILKSNLSIGVQNMTLKSIHYISPSSCISQHRDCLNPSFLIACNLPQFGHCHHIFSCYLLCAMNVSFLLSSSGSYSLWSWFLFLPRLPILSHPYFMSNPLLLFCFSFRLRSYMELFQLIFNVYIRHSMWLCFSNLPSIDFIYTAIVNSSA